MTTKPSQLKENEALAIKNGPAQITFHRWYGDLRTISQPASADPRDTETGLQISTDEAFADKLYAEYTEMIRNRDNKDQDKYPKACDEVEIWAYSENANEDSASYDQGKKIL